MEEKEDSSSKDMEDKEDSSGKEMEEKEDSSSEEMEEKEDSDSEEMEEKEDSSSNEMEEKEDSSNKSVNEKVVNMESVSKSISNGEPLKNTSSEKEEGTAAKGDLGEEDLKEKRQEDETVQDKKELQANKENDEH